MKIVPVFTNYRYYTEFKNLYKNAFPAVEKKPFSLIEQLTAAGKAVMYAFEDNDIFLGMAVLLKSDNVLLLDYFAIASNERNKGLGGKALSLIKDLAENRKLILEIERDDVLAKNAEERRRRKAFYMKNGIKETGIFAKVYHTDFEILGYNGTVTFDEYYQTLKETLGDEGIKIINPIEIR